MHVGHSLTVAVAAAVGHASAVTVAVTAAAVATLTSPAGLPPYWPLL